MQSTALGRLTWFVRGGFAIIALCGQLAHAGILTADLTCVLSGPTSVPCGASSFGRVTLDDGLVAGKIFVTVDVQGTAGKFRDLMLSFAGTGITGISSADGQAFLSPNGLSLPSYTGLFDVGASDQQNWNSTSALYTTLLTGTGGGLNVGMFDFEDSAGKLNVALHLQDLATGGSLKVGGIWEGDDVPREEVPEPATAALLGGGLILLAWTWRRRSAS